MRTAHVVIGAAFGDEGKGLLTDHLTRIHKARTVVRFNGGAQAGHTVQTANTRHVFHHFGSGTLARAATHLSRHFIANPMLFWEEERDLLFGASVQPEVSIDPRALLTTPYDMMINQMVEEARGTARHGSCGVGINETIKRAELFRATTVEDLSDPFYLIDVLRKIRDEWVPTRLAMLGIAPSEAWTTRLTSNWPITRFLGTISAFQQRVTFRHDAEALQDGPVVFEGAQGLLLDEDHHFFPHVTHSHTGLTNVRELAAEAGIERLEVTYAMRAYMTRHGAGPFPTEAPAMRYEDRTNVPNDWQGTLRFGTLDLDLIADAIDRDRAVGGIAIDAGLAITCLDQVADEVGVRYGGSDHRVARETLPALVSKVIGLPVRFVSRGPTSADWLLR
jgi:adenylosuccinate synthase